MRIILLCLLLAGCGSGDPEPEPIVICEKDLVDCEVQYAPTKAHYGSSDVAIR